MKNTDEGLHPNEAGEKILQEEYRRHFDTLPEATPPTSWWKRWLRRKFHAVMCAAGAHDFNYSDDEGYNPIDGFVVCKHCYRGFPDGGRDE